MQFVSRKGKKEEGRGGVEGIATKQVSNLSVPYTLTNDISFLRERIRVKDEQNDIIQLFSSC